MFRSLATTRFRAVMTAKNRLTVARAFCTPHGLTDEDIAKANTMSPILGMASDKLGLDADSLEPYGRFKAKVPHSVLKTLDAKEDGKLILVTALSPTTAGEGKTCTSVGLADGLCHIGKNAMVALREPSLGPVFGMKGGAAGGGYAQVVPMDEINLHFTGDMHAIGAAHNLLAAMVDNHIKWNKAPQLDTNRIAWRRVVDMNDRALRQVVVGLGPAPNGVVREDGFDITVASEVMAILCLADGLDDLQRRLGNIIVGFTRKREPVTAKDLNADGAMSALLKDAIQPNLVQTLEKNPALVHGGPFANIAHGCSTVTATKAALKMSDYVVTEGGFGADLGAEKFFNIKCRKAGLAPDACVIVATVRALKLHGGVGAKELVPENLPAIGQGMCNLERHISNVKKFGIEPVVCINQFPTDTPAELQAVMDACAEVGVKAVVSNHHGHGGAGAADLAKAVAESADSGSANFTTLYDDDLTLEQKIRKIATEIYGAADINIEKDARTKIKQFEKLGAGSFPVCMAKTQYSFSADPTGIGAPSGHTIPVADVRLSAGAEFVVVLTGSIMTMPGLPKVPAAENVGIDGDGTVVGLF